VYKRGGFAAVAVIALGWPTENARRKQHVHDGGLGASEAHGGHPEGRRGAIRGRLGL
jgi:hypothetical protein